MLPVAAAFFVFGYLLQAAVINPFITRPEHSQFMLLVAIAIILVNTMLMIFGPDARSVQVDYQLESYELGPILLDKARLLAAGAAVIAAAGLFTFFRYTLTGKAIRACADNYLGAKVVGLNAGFTFEAVLIAADAYKRAKSTDPKTLADAIRKCNITEKMMLGGPIKFNEKGQVEDIDSACVQNLNMLPTVVLPTSAATAKPVFPAPGYKKA